MDIKQKINEAKIKIKYEVQKGYYWCKENPELAIPIASMIFAGGKYLGKAAIKHKQVKEQENVKNLYCYDRSLGHYWKLRRELRNDEWLEVDRRKKNGERLSDILDSLHVLD